jgi:hypothetical protein
MVTNTLDTVCENPTLHEIHRGTIRAHHAKPGYDYPTIRLPFTFSGLIGLSTRIYQTVHNGALAFLVVVSPMSESSPDKHENAIISAVPPAFTRRRSAFESPRAHFAVGDFLYERIDFDIIITRRVSVATETH